MAGFWQPTPTHTDGWVNYMPTISQGNTIAKIVEGARYAWSGGDWLVCQISLQMTQSGISQNDIMLSKPRVTTATQETVGFGYLYDCSANLYHAVHVVDTASTQWTLHLAGEWPGPTLNNGDIVRVEIGPPLSRGDR